MTWQAMYGSGQTVFILAAIALSAAAVGPTPATTVLSGTAPTTARLGPPATLVFGCAAEYSLAWIFRYPFQYAFSILWSRQPANGNGSKVGWVDHNMLCPIPAAIQCQSQNLLMWVKCAVDREVDEHFLWVENPRRVDILLESVLESLQC